MAKLQITSKEEEEERGGLEYLITEVGGQEANEALLKLPLDIFLDIISRLPIKSLAVSRCVCRTWLIIVHHPRFTNMHHTKAIQQQKPHVFNRATSILFFEKFDGDWYHKIHLLEHEKDGSLENGVFVTARFDDPNLAFDFVGSCNGLLCLSDKYHCDPVYVCNPVMGEYIKLPQVEKSTKYNVVSGFGFDLVKNVYKVVRMVYNSIDVVPGGNSTHSLEAEIYTLGCSKGWRKLENVPYPPCRLFRVFVNGVLHWLVNKFICPSDSGVIVAFDVGREEFRVIPPPLDLIPSCEIVHLQVAEVGGHLSLFDHSFHDHCKIWLMKEYGVKGYWTKQYVISLYGVGLTRAYFSPVMSLENGNILLSTDQGLVCYEATTRSISKVDLLKVPPFCNATKTHVGSFLSLRDIVGPTKSKHCVSSGKWYGTMNPILLS